MSFKNRDREVSGQTVTPICAAIRGQGSPGRIGEERESVIEYDEKGGEEGEGRRGRWWKKKKRRRGGRERRRLIGLTFTGQPNAAAYLIN